MQSSLEFPQIELENEKIDRSLDLPPEPDLRHETVIRVKPVYEISGKGCQCLGFMQYKLDGFDSSSYMQMLSDPETMQAIKEIYYNPQSIQDEPIIPDRPELQLEY